MRQWFYFSTKCHADLWPFIQCHSFELPHPYLNIGFSEITGLLMEYSLDCFRSLDQNGCNPHVWYNKICFIISRSWLWPFLTLLKRSAECLRTFRPSSFLDWPLPFCNWLVIIHRLSSGPYFSYCSYFSLLFSLPEQKAHVWANSIPVTPTSVRLCVRPSTFSNIFSSETTSPLKRKFHMDTP